MQISPKFIIVVLFILPNLALADSVLDDTSSANTVSFTQYPMSSGLVKFNSLLISEGSNLIQSSGNAFFLAWITNQSQPVLTGNIRTSLGGTLVMSNTGGAIVTMGAGGVTAGVTASPAIIASVPEPSNFSMLAMGLLGIGLVVRRKANKH